MFKSLGKKFRSLFSSLTGSVSQSRLEKALAEMRVMLLEASVPATLVGQFIETIKQKAAGELEQSAIPAKLLQKISYQELCAILKQAQATLEIGKPPFKMLLVGLQGAGKTTAIGKLTKYLNRKTVVASTDVTRPAAQQQLETLANQSGATFIKPEKLTEQAIVAQALKQVAQTSQAGEQAELLIIDSAGRSPSLPDAIGVAKSIHKALKPDETLLVLDAALGQTAADVVAGFADALTIDGAILTRLDGDAAGGAILAVAASGIKVKFISYGESLDTLEPFDHERLAARILGFEKDALKQLEELLQPTEDAPEQEEESFDLHTFARQLEKLQGGGIQKLTRLLPSLPMAQGMGDLPEEVDEEPIKIQKAILASMTPKEKTDPSIIKASRKRRIAGGSGTKVEDVNLLLNRYNQALQLMRQDPSMAASATTRPKKKRLAFRP